MVIHLHEVYKYSYPQPSVTHSLIDSLGRSQRTIMKVFLCLCVVFLTTVLVVGGDLAGGKLPVTSADKEDVDKCKALVEPLLKNVKDEPGYKKTVDIKYNKAEKQVVSGMNYDLYFMKTTSIVCANDPKSNALCLPEHLATTKELCSASCYDPLPATKKPMEVSNQPKCSPKLCGEKE